MLNEVDQLFLRNLLLHNFLRLGSSVSNKSPHLTDMRYQSFEIVLGEVNPRLLMLLNLLENRFVVIFHIGNPFIQIDYTLSVVL
jgi:hypothetical protein